MLSSQQNILKNKNIYLIFSVTLFAVMGVASITPAFPSIIKCFSLSGKEVTLLITVFTLPGMFLAPFTGILADKYGRKTILIPSLLLFGLAGVACSFQDDFQGLLLFRFFQGLGATSLGSINITLIGDLYSGNQRTQAMGYNSSVLSIGIAVYPVVGGALATINWQYIFYLPALALPLVFIILFALDNPAVNNKVPIKEYLEKLWKTIYRKDVWGLFFINILTFIVLYGAYLSFFPIMMERRFSANPFTIGIVMSSMSLITAVTSSQLGRIRKKVAAKSLLYFCAVFYAASLFLLAFAYIWLVLIISVMFFGLVHGLLIPNIQTMLVGLAPTSERAAFMSLNSTVLRAGQTIGPVLIGFFYFDQELQYVFIAGAVVALSMIFFVRFMVKTENDTK
ncbi:MAG: MFS transporter [Bacteroidota bacterium]